MRTFIEQRTNTRAFITRESLCSLSNFERTVWHYESYMSHARWNFATVGRHRFRTSRRKSEMPFKVGNWSLRPSTFHLFGLSAFTQDLPLPRKPSNHLDPFQTINENWSILITSSLPSSQPKSFCRLLSAIFLTPQEFLNILIVHFWQLFYKFDARKNL